MAASFHAQVDQWVLDSQARLLAVFRTAAQFVIEDAQTVRGAGGNMRVDTGYLRASGQASLSGMPMIRADARPAEGGAYSYNGGPVALTIAGADLGDTIYFGWTASYAGYRENTDGFVRLAAQNWQQHVNRATAEAKRRAG